VILVSSSSTANQSGPAPFLAAFSPVQPDVLRLITIVRPEPVVRWHLAGIRLFWNHKFYGKSGRPRLPRKVRSLIREISIANPLWGTPRIHIELLKLGIDVSLSKIANYLTMSS
jgi:hypothetical protein